MNQQDRRPSCQSTRKAVVNPFHCIHGNFVRYRDSLKRLTYHVLIIGYASSRTNALSGRSVRIRVLRCATDVRMPGPRMAIEILFQHCLTSLRLRVRIVSPRRSLRVRFVAAIDVR